MKKIAFLLACLCSFLVAGIDFNEQKDIDKLVLAGLKTNIKNVDKNSGGVWYLSIAQRPKWDKYRNDEFELQSAIEQAYPILISEIEKYQSLIGSSTSTNLRIEFGEYDFSKEAFPLKRMMRAESYISYSGSTIGSYYDGARLSFNNAKGNDEFLPMPKEQAKLFLQKRKSSGGSVDRDLIAKYYFKISSSETSDKFLIGCMQSKGYTSNCQTLQGNIKGHIEKIEIIDPKDKEKVLGTLTY